MPFRLDRVVARQSVSTDDARTRNWSAITEALVASASVPFSILVLPQLLQNYTTLQSGNLTALAAVSWVTWMSNLNGNLLMFNHFSSSGERSAIMLQLIGIAGNFGVLTQLWLGQALASPIYLAASAFLATGCFLNFSKMLGNLRVSSWSQGAGLWRGWQFLSGLVGLAAVPQVLWLTFFPGSTTLLPGIATLVISALALHSHLSRLAGSQADALLDRLPGLSATMCFALSPLPQLMRNFSDPGSLAGLSIGTMALALLGNALCFPRALLLRDYIWLAGTSWACWVGGWLQLTSMTLGKAADTGLPYLGTPLYLAMTGTLTLWFLLVGAVDKGLREQGGQATA